MVICNSFFNDESVIPYILRHTQLLPRQFFRYLNGIFVKNRRLGNDYLKISSQAIKDGVAEHEQFIIGEIFSAFKYAYPDARRVCERCIPELPYAFSYSLLHKMYTRHAKAVMVGGDYYDFVRMLVEIGCVGRVIGGTDRYHIGEFEYTRPSRLTVSTSDTLCLHPVFSKILSARRPDINGKVIYPYGSDVQGIDHRDW